MNQRSSRLVPAVLLLIVFWTFPSRCPGDDPAVEGPLAKQRVAEQIRRMTSEQIVLRAGALAGEMSGERDDALFLEGTLALLHQHRFHDAWLQRPPVNLLSRVAAHSWRTMPGETTHDTFGRLQKEFEVDESSSVSQYKELRRSFQELSGKEWPFDWRSKREWWLEVIKAVGQSASADDRAAVWRDKIKADADNAKLYCTCYLAVVRNAGPSPVDFALLEPLMDNDDPYQRLMWQAHVLRALDHAGVRVDDQRRKKLREQFLANAKATSLDIPSGEGVVECLAALSDVYLHCDQDAEGHPLAQILRDHQKAEYFLHFARVAGLSVRRQHEWMLAKTVAVDFRDLPLHAALKQLQQQVRLPLLIAEDARVDETLVTLKMTGPWLDVVEQVLETTEYRWIPFPDQLFWIGRRRDINAIKTLLARDASQQPRINSILDAVLVEVTKLQCIDTPLQDVYGYLEDRHGVQIELLGDVDLDVTADVIELPLYVGLNILAGETGLNWRIFDEIILIGRPDALAKVAEREEHWLRRTVRHAARGAKTAKVLDEKTKFAFIEKPLADVATYFKDRHGIEIEVAKAQQGSPITMDMAGVSLSIALDLLALRHGLDWDADADMIFIGDEKVVDEFRKMR